MQQRARRSERRTLPLAAGGLLLALACARPAPPPAPPELPAPAVPEVLAPPPAAPCRRIEHVFVHKGERTLTAHCEGGARIVLPVALGRATEGPKLAAGDQRTPEGEYRISGPARASRFHRFLPLDYPSPADAERALREGRLSRRDHARVLAAHAAGVAPPEDTPLGGRIGFHGEGARWRGESRLLDWTEGCIALGDHDLDWLIARAPVGTPVTILAAGAPAPP